MRVPAAVLAVSLALGAPIAAADRPGLRVTDREVLAAPPTSCTEVATSDSPTAPVPVRRGAEASPSAVVDGDGVRVVWQQDVAHAAGGAVTTIAASLSTRVGGPCGTPAGADSVGMPSTARGSDGRVWTAVHENGAGGSRVLLSDGRTTTVVEELQGVEVLPATVAVDPQDPTRVHVAYSWNAFPAGTVSVHREVHDGVVSAPHPFWYGPTPAAYDFREQLVALGGDALLAVSTEVDTASLAGLAPSYAERTDLTQAPVVVNARRSTDGGVTWTAPTQVMHLDNGAVRDAQGGTALRSLAHPSVALGRDGRVHVAAESVGASHTSLLSVSSADGGRTWSTVRSLGRPGLALHAAVAVDGAGRTALSWLDVAPDLTAVWRAALVGDSGVVDLGPAFSLRALAPAYVGDQSALVALPKGFAAVTVQGTGNPGNPTDVVVARLR